MIKKLYLYIGLILLSVNIVNGNLFSLFSYVRQRDNINKISPEKFNICKPLQNKLEDYTYNFNSNISVSILDESGDFIVDINGDIPRIPASNQKILSSAFSLDTLGPYYTLKTSLKEINDGSLYIEASGDPDFDKSHLEELINDLNSTNHNPTLKLPIIIKTSNTKNWWPASWSYADRKEEYGAPITKYSIASNSSINALNNPIDNFIYELENTLRKNNLSKKYFVKAVNEEYPIDDISTIKVIISARLYILLNVVNSENFIFADASGLSRKNRVTTYGLSQFLRRMKFNRFSDYYFSSFSILGVRGSLANVNAPVNLKGRILAKSGRLNDVRSVSGFILGEDKIFSIIVNNMDNSTRHIMKILSIVDNTDNCN